MSAKLSHDDFWEIPPLSPDEQDLVNAYREIGKPFEQLAYTESFDRLITMLGKPNTNDQKFLVYQRLQRLEKQGRLPSLFLASSKSF